MRADDHAVHLSLFTGKGIIHLGLRFHDLSFLCGNLLLQVIHALFDLGNLIIQLRNVIIQILLLGLQTLFDPLYVA